MVTLQRWPGYKFIKCKFTLCPSLWAKNMGFISGTNLRELILFCCSLTCPKLCVAIVWAIFLSFPALIPHGWCPYHLTSAQDLRVWILFSLFFIFYFFLFFSKICVFALECCSALQWVSTAKVWLWGAAAVAFEERLGLVGHSWIQPAPVVPLQGTAGPSTTGIVLL